MKKLNLLALFMGFTFLLFGQQQNTSHEIILQALQEAGIPFPTDNNTTTTSNSITPPLEWLQDSSYAYSWIDDDWYLQRRTISETRDEYGNLLTSLSEITENSTTPWEPTGRTVSSYHNPTTRATFMGFRWNTDTEDWVETTNIIEDENGNTTSITIFFWDYNTNSISGGIKVDYTYNGELLQEYIVYRRETNDWVEDLKVINTYNADNLLETLLEQEWEQGWVNRSRRNFEYSTDDLPQTITDQDWDNSSQTFINVQLTESSYTIDLEIETRLISFWNTTTNSWDISRKTEYSYNNSGLLSNTSMFSWVDSDWIETNHSETEYDSNNNLIRQSDYALDSYGEWVWAAQELFEFDGNNNRTRRTRQIWDIYEQTFINNSRTDYFFSLQDIMLDVADHKNIQLKVSPNPSRGVFNITTESMSTSNLNIKVTDISGRNILTTTTSGSNHTIDLSNQASGLYFLYVNDAIPQKIVLK